VANSYISSWIILLKHTLRFLRKTGQSANISTAQVIVVNACQVVERRDAKQTDANMAAFKDRDCDTLK